MHKKIVSEPPKREVSQESVLINTEFMVALALELMLRETERRMEMESACFQRETKQKFNYFLDNTKKALHYAEELTQEIYKVDSKSKWRNIPVWQDESNELARLILLYADRSADVDNVNKVFKLLRELPGEDIITEELLDRFRLKTL